MYIMGNISAMEQRFHVCSILVLALYIDGHPLAGGFHYRFCVIFHLSGGVIFRPTQSHPNIAGFIINPHHPPVQCNIYTNLYHTYTISTACMACHLTDSQISLQADWLWLCSLQASVHIYTVTYRVTYRLSEIGGGIMGNY